MFTEDWVVGMKKKRSVIIVSIFALLVLCELLIPVDDSQIYATVFRNLVTKDDTYGGELNPRKVYISRKLVDLFASLEGRTGKEGQKFKEEHQAFVSSTAEELGISIVWISSSEELRLNGNGEIEDRGVLIEFGEIENWLVYAQASGSIYVVKGVAGGYRYDFIKIFTGWSYLFTSAQWIS